MGYEVHARRETNKLIEEHKAIRMRRWKAKPHELMFGEITSGVLGFVEVNGENLCWLRLRVSLAWVKFLLRVLTPLIQCLMRYSCHFGEEKPYSKQTEPEVQQIKNAMREQI